METIKIAFTEGNPLLILSIVFAFATYYIYDLARRYMSALLELRLKKSVDLAKRRLATAHTESEKRLATAELLSAYNQACIAYLSKQILPESFWRSYAVELERIVDSEKYKEMFQANQEDYLGILLAYEKFKNRKKRT